MNELEDTLSTKNAFEFVKCNMIFTNFIAALSMSVSEISELVSALIKPTTYSARFCKLRIHQLELKFNSKPYSLEKSAIVRLYITNVSGPNIDVSVYTEEQDENGMVNKFNLRENYQINNITDI